MSRRLRQELHRYSFTGTSSRRISHIFLVIRPAKGTHPRHPAARERHRVAMVSVRGAGEDEGDHAGEHDDADSGVDGVGVDPPHTRLPACWAPTSGTGGASITAGPRSTHGRPAVGRGQQGTAGPPV